MDEYTTALMISLDELVHANEDLLDDYKPIQDCLFTQPDASPSHK